MRTTATLLVILLATASISLPAYAGQTEAGSTVIKTASLPDPRHRLLVGYASTTTTIIGIPIAIEPAAGSVLLRPAGTAMPVNWETVDVRALEFVDPAGIQRHGLPIQWDGGRGYVVPITQTTEDPTGVRYNWAAIIDTHWIGAGPVETQLA